MASVRSAWTVSLALVLAGRRWRLAMAGSGRASQIVFPRRREEVNDLTRLDDLKRVFGVPRYGVAIFRLKDYIVAAKPDAELTREHVAALLVRMLVERDRVVRSVAHSSDHRFLTLLASSPMSNVSSVRYWFSVHSTGDFSASFLGYMRATLHLVQYYRTPAPCSSPYRNCLASPRCSRSWKCWFRKLRRHS